MKQKILVGLSCLLFLCLLIETMPVFALVESGNSTAFFDDATEKKGKFDDYLIETRSPENITINLFDYWLLEDRYATDNAIVEGVPGTGSTAQDWTPKALLNPNGINYGHAFIFQAGGPMGPSYNNWTRETGAAVEGIVEEKLENGYPVFNQNENAINNEFQKHFNDGYIEKLPPARESLDYLFDPDKKHNGKISFTDVGGLLRIDDNGNYTYSSLTNFAEFDEENNRFKVYETYAIDKSGHTSAAGMFFPFNKAESQTGDLFTIQDDKLKAAPKSCDDDVNHYFGLTMAAEFQQPPNGKVSKNFEPTPMFFEFTGDDDIWIFIDGVLVADLGGIHDTLTTKIDFSTGEIVIKRYDGKGQAVKTTIKEQFEKADAYNPDDFSETDSEIFKDNTMHELKVFYLERGNVASNLTLSFNLSDPVYNELIKLDQDGEPIANATFDLYEADEKFAPVNENAPITRITTDESGRADITKTDENGQKRTLTFKDGGKYILREVATPVGFVTTGDIHLIYDKKTNIFKVDNSWETGAVGGFKVNIIEAGEILDGTSSEVELDDAKNGLIFAVPLINPDAKNQSNNSRSWRPLYGSPLGGFHMVEMENTDDKAYRKAVLEAALRQQIEPDVECWHIDYDRERKRFEGLLTDLPGTADRYVFENKENGDMHVVYYLLEADSELFDPNLTAEEKLKAIEEKVYNENPETMTENIQAFVEENEVHIKMLDLKNFLRLYYNQLYVPNQVRTLRVHKQDDENKTPLQGAEFTLYEDKACTVPLAKGITDNEGNLSFSAQNTGNNAVGGGEATSDVNFALMLGSDGQERSYWLKETAAPEDFVKNPNPIEIRITKDSIYANAGVEDDGISVRKGVGKLLETMVAYASDGAVDVTLRDIIATGYIHGNVEGDNLSPFGTDDWKPTDKKLELHYGLDSAIFDYGLHNAEEAPWFEAITGWVGFKITQNYNAHTDPNDEFAGSERKENLGDRDLSALMTGTTTVIVEDEREIPFTFTKVDAQTQEPLNGAQFSIYRLTCTDDSHGDHGDELLNTAELGSCWELAGTHTDGAEINFNDLYDGTYRLVETKAPDGYLLTEGQWQIVLSDTEPIKITVVGDNLPLAFIDNKDSDGKLLLPNRKPIDMPATGGIGTFMYPLGGLLLIAGSIILLLYRKELERFWKKIKGGDSAD